MKGGLVVQWHNEIRDAVTVMVWGQVIREPIVSDAVLDPGGQTLVADLIVRCSFCRHCRPVLSNSITQVFTFWC